MTDTLPDQGVVGGGRRAGLVNGAITVVQGTARAPNHRPIGTE